jgi:predicted aspartyl protease/Flp pilus assembly protein TadD
MHRHNAVLNRTTRCIDAARRSVGHLFRVGFRSTLVASACVTLLLGVLILPPSVYAGDKALDRAQRAVRAGDLDLAEKIYRELLTKNPQYKEARLGLSFALYKKRNLTDAFDHAARVIAEDPLSASAHSILGLVILTTGDFRRSIEEFRTALSLKSNDARAVAGLAMVDFYENRMDQSVQGLRRASFLDPNEPDFVYDLGQIASRTERFREAADAYERFLAIAPKTDTDRRARIRGLIDFLRYLGSQGSLYSTSGESRTTVPFERTGSRPIINVRINGMREPLRFVLDTGSGMSVISEKTARRLGIKSVARGGLARGVGGGGRFDIVYSFLETLDIGDVRISNVPVYLRHIFASGIDVDGYIGLSVISKYVATVDYGVGNFTLARGRGSEEEIQTGNSDQRGVPTSAQAGRFEIPMRFTSSGFLSGEVVVDGINRPLNFIIDTGADISVISEALFKSEDFDSFARGARIPIYGAAGIAESVVTLYLPRVSVGAHVREGVQAAVLDLEPINETAGFDQVGILGGNFLRHFRVVFDFQRSVMRLEQLRGPQKVESPAREGAIPEQP